MGAIYNIKKDLKRDKIIKHYANHDRLIAPALYQKLKSMKKCMKCKKKFSGRIPSIHHIKPVKQYHKEGITDPIIINAEKNLMSVCVKCHEVLDRECELKYETKKVN